MFAWLPVFFVFVHICECVFVCVCVFVGGHVFKCLRNTASNWMLQYVYEYVLAAI